MKRPLALIGITYLSTLVVAFYFPDIYTLVIALVFLLASLVTIFLKIDRYKRITALAQFCTVVLACCASLFYTNFVYTPTVEHLDKTDVKITATLTEEPRNYYGKFLHTFETQTINGKKENVKINLISSKILDMEVFDKISCTVNISETDSPSNISKGVFFTAYTGYNFKYKVTHTEQKPLYYHAIKLRQYMSNALDSVLPSDCSSLCKAVLLGDKYSLPSDVLSAFSDTGVTFLIVVSGMHLVVVCRFVLFVVEKVTKNRIAQSLSVLIFVFVFMAVTGFTSSVVRAGVMTFVVYLGRIFHRDGDALNSLGLAAIVLTLFNPYAVGDVGMLLSFAATAGIILWCEPISAFIIKKLPEPKYGKKILESYVSLFSASLSASLWVIPITVFSFGNISPYSVIISLLVSQFVSIIIVCSLLVVVFFYTFKFIAYPFAFAAKLCSRYVVFIISSFADFPFASVNADRIYFYIWVIFSVILAVCGYYAKHKGRYVKYSVIFSVCVLIFGYSFYTFVDINTTYLTVYNTLGGITAYVRNGENSSVLSCGGRESKWWSVMNDMSTHITRLDFLIVPSTNNKYDLYLESLQTEFDVSQILVYDNKQIAKNDVCQYFGENVSFSLYLNNNTINNVTNIDGKTFQHLHTQGKTILIAPSNADLSLLPEEYQSADFLVSNGVPKNTEILKCDSVILTVSDKKIVSKAQQNFEKVTYVEDKITIDIS